MLKSDVEKIYPQLFNSIFNKLKEMGDNYDVDLSKDEILMFISALCTLVEFSDAYPKTFYAQMADAFKINMMPCVIAKGQTLGDNSSCFAVMKLAKLPEFPTKKVAKHLCEQQMYHQLSAPKLMRNVEFAFNNKVRNSLKII